MTASGASTDGASGGFAGDNDVGAGDRDGAVRVRRRCMSEGIRSSREDGPFQRQSGPGGASD